MRKHLAWLMGRVTRDERTLGEVLSDELLKDVKYAAFVTQINELHHIRSEFETLKTKVDMLSVSVKNMTYPQEVRENEPS